MSMRLSSCQMEPCVRGSRPARQFRAVDFPQPGSKQGDELALLDRQAQVGESVCLAETASDTVEPQFAELFGRRDGVGHLAALDPAMLRFHRSNAATMAVYGRGTTVGLLAIRLSYSGRPYLEMTSWLAWGAMESVTSLIAGPG